MRLQVSQPNPSIKLKLVALVVSPIFFLCSRRATACASEIQAKGKELKQKQGKFWALNNNLHVRDCVNILKNFVERRSLAEVKLIHGRLKKRDIISDERVLWHSLIDAYTKLRKLGDARRVFEEMPDQMRMADSWNLMIRACGKEGFAEEALGLFHRMQERAFSVPDPYTFTSVLHICAKMRALEEGVKIHGGALKGGFLSDVFVVNALMDMYVKCGSLEDARQLLDEMSQRDVVSWTTVITAYAQNGQGEEALRFFQRMKFSGVKPNLKTFASILPVCGNLAAVEQGMEIHEEIIRSGMGCDIFVESSLVDMYAKCGKMDKARELFNNMHRRDAVSWTVMIGGCAQNGMEEEALKLFQQMKLVGVKPIAETFASVLPACSNLAAVDQGMTVHKDILTTGFQCDLFVANALIDMYAKCGSIAEAHYLFDSMHHRNVSSWTAMLAGYGMHGFGKEALQLFEQMECSGLNPDNITLACVLAACCHSGLVEEGQHYFNCMSKIYHIEPGMVHYSCMVDLLGRAGRVDEAQDFIKKMPIAPGATVWKCLLSACRTHDHIEVGEWAAEHLFELDPKSSSSYVLLSNMYAAVGRWRDFEMTRKLMRDRGVKKTPGISWIQVNKQAHTFLVGDRSHPLTEQIYAQLEN